MSNDLISRNAVFAIIENKRLLVGNQNISDGFKLAELQKEVEKLPVAYDANRVMDMLSHAIEPTNEHRHRFCGTVSESHCVRCEDCETCISEALIKIVESGGMK